MACAATPAVVIDKCPRFSSHRGAVQEFSSSCLADTTNHENKGETAAGLNKLKPAPSRGPEIVLAWSG